MYLYYLFQSYQTKSFNFWGIKKAILSSILQAAKAITGGVIAVKGQLLKAKGHAVVAKGKLLQTKGEAITNYGRNVATHAFDVHPQPHIDVHSAIGLFNHLPITPVHQPTSKQFLNLLNSFILTLNMFVRVCVWEREINIITVRTGLKSIMYYKTLYLPTQDVCTIVTCPRWRLVNNGQTSTHTRDMNFFKT